MTTRRATAVTGASPVRHRGGNGEPLLLLHGFTANADAWNPVLPALERRHEVTVVTFHGHMGGPPIPEGFGHTIAESTDLAEASLDAEGMDKVHVVGNSLGGWLAIELARRGRARSVVAISPGGGWEKGSSEQRRLQKHFTRIRSLLRVGGPLASVLARFSASRRFALRDIVAHPERMSPADARNMIEAAWRCDAFDGVMAALPRELAPEAMDPLPCPIRLVWGTADRMLPMGRYSDRWRRVLPAAEWVELEGAGHCPMFDDPDAVARAILELTDRGRA
ncbi:MAG: alpha/beta fold hydrolase [Polyangiaceae bacterium]|jgi:pimeloyl-ACP methyl ester carboxylesterase